MKATLRWVLFQLFGDLPRTAVVVAAAYAPAAPRDRLLARLGVQNHGTIGRRVQFNNAAVRIGRGAHIGDRCRFEGGATITIADGVRLAPKTVITTVGSLNRDGLLHDEPVSIVEPPDNRCVAISVIEK